LIVTVYPHIAARAWRKSLGLSRVELARRIGFSPSQIQDYEEGARRGKKKAEEAAISDAAWLRYGLACAALSAGLKLPF
jgi:predicted transcriptional regulator